MDDTDTGKDKNLEKDFGHAFGMHEESGLNFSKILKEFKSLDYRFLIPLSKIFDAKLLRKKAVQWIMFFGLLPLIYAWIAFKYELEFVQVVWMIEIYFCLFWALYFYSIIQPTKTVWRQGIGYALFTAVIGIPVLLSLQTFPVVRDLYGGLSSRNLFSQLTGFVLGVGILEETCKALPLIIFGLRKKTIRGIRDGVFLGFLSGLGFAASEGVTYTVRATADALYYGSATGQVITLLDRVMSGPLQHSAWAGVVGWFIGVAAQRTESKWPIVIVGILFMALLHGLYDTFSDGIVGILLAALGYLIFMAYLIHGDTPSSKVNSEKQEENLQPESSIKVEQNKI
jgi:RsiW-degrading membrane proteinase PrsW (M82 family)